MVTVVFQQHFLWPHLTLRDNIGLPVKGRPGAARVVKEMLQLFQMETFADRFPNQVSLGQRQRAALARAFALEPRYILLDEITSALDVEQTATVMRYLLLLRSRGVGILIVTHLLGFAKQLMARAEGDMAYFLEAGQVRGAGGADFFTTPTNERMRAFIASSDYRPDDFEANPSQSATNTAR
jgi:ABC-type polar amino acid transport system ATPase subunit